MARKVSDKTRRDGAAAPGSRRAATPPGWPGSAAGIRPWHLLALATLIAVAVSVAVTGGTTVANTVAVAVTVVSAALVAAAAGRTIVPLLSPDAGEQVEMIAGRTRAALEREKMLVLRAIKEVEFDRAMKKISEADFQEMSIRLRGRAAGIMRQLDGEGRGYRAIIERDLATRVGSSNADAARAGAGDRATASGRACPSCGAQADADARFCKSCGAKIEVAE